VDKFSKVSLKELKEIPACVVDLGALSGCPERAIASSDAATYASWLRRPGRAQGRRVERNKRVTDGFHWVQPILPGGDDEAFLLEPLP
jgi:hypothetical protein